MAFKKKKLLWDNIVIGALREIFFQNGFVVKIKGSFCIVTYGWMVLFGLLRNHEVFPKEKVEKLLSRKKSIDFWFLHFLLWYVVTYQIDSHAYQYPVLKEKTYSSLVGVKYSDSSPRWSRVLPVSSWLFLSLGCIYYLFCTFGFSLWRILPIAVLLY